MTHRAAQRAAGRWRPTRRENKTKPATAGDRHIALVTKDARSTPLDQYELRRVVSVPVTIDESGWQRGTIEMFFIRTEDGIHPTEIRVGAGTPAADVRKLGNAFELCERYNRVVNQLRLVGSDEIMEMIIVRQEERMGYRRVNYFTLAQEIQFLEASLKRITT